MAEVIITNADAGSSKVKDIHSTLTVSGWSSNFSSSVNVGFIPSAIYDHMHSIMQNHINMI